MHEFLTGARGLPVLQYIQTGCGLSTVTSVTGARGSFSGGQSGLGHEAVHCHLVLRLRMSGAVLLLPPYSVIACTGTFPSHLANRSEVETVNGCVEVNQNCLGLCSKHQHSQLANSNGLSEVLRHYKLDTHLKEVMLTDVLVVQ